MTDDSTAGATTGDAWRVKADAAAKAEAPDPRFEKAGFPATLYIGKEAGQWVLSAFADEVHAVQWMQTAPGKRSMHRVTLCDITDLELEQPKPFLRVRGS